MPEPEAPLGAAGRIGANIRRMLTNSAGVLALHFVATILLSRWLLPEGKGIYALVILIPMTLARVASLGMPQALTHYVGKDESRVPALLAGATLVAAVAGGACIVAFAVVERSYPLAIFAHAPTPAKIAAVGIVPLLLWVQFASGLLLGLDRQAAYRGVRLTEAVALLVGVAALVVGRGYLVYGALGAWLASQVAAAAVCLATLARYRLLRFRWDGALLLRCLRYGGAAWIGGMASYLLLRADLYLVNAYLGSEAVGHYSVAVALFTILFTLPLSGALAVLPQVTRTDAAEARRITALTSRVITLACVVVASVSLLVAPAGVVLLFGEAFAPAIAPLLLLLPVFLLFGAGAIVHAAMQGMGDLRPYAYANLAGMVLNITLNLFWIPRWGLPGAAAASTIAYLLMAALQVAAYARRSGTPVRDLLIVKRDDWSLVADFVRFRRPPQLGTAAPAATPTAHP